METKAHKNAVQFSDQVSCSYCGKTWDVNDFDPPECSVEPHIPPRTGVTTGRWTSVPQSAWPTPVKAFVVYQGDTGLLVWDFTREAAEEQARRVGMTPDATVPVDINTHDGHRVSPPYVAYSPVHRKAAGHLIREHAKRVIHIVTPLEWCRCLRTGEVPK